MKSWLFLLTIPQLPNIYQTAYKVIRGFCSYIQLRYRPQPLPDLAFDAGSFLLWGRFWGIWGKFWRVITYIWVNSCLSKVQPITLFRIKELICFQLFLFSSPALLYNFSTPGKSYQSDLHFASQELLPSLPAQGISSESHSYPALIE